MNGRRVREENPAALMYQLKQYLKKGNGGEEVLLADLADIDFSFCF